MPFAPFFILITDYTSIHEIYSLKLLDYFNIHASITSCLPLKNAILFSTFINCMLSTVLVRFFILITDLHINT